MNKNTVTIQEKINSPVKKVWSFYNDPKHIVNWNFASSDWHCPKAENDLQVGGSLKTRMEAKDGSFGFDFVAHYEQVELEQKLVYRLEDDRSVDIHFTENENQTTINITFETEDLNSSEAQREGWQSILTNFKNYVEKTQES